MSRLLLVTLALWCHLSVVKMSYVDACTSAVWCWWIETVGLELTCRIVMPATVLILCLSGCCMSVCASGIQGVMRKSFDHLYIYSCIYYCSVDLGCLDLHWKNPSRNRILEGWDLGMERHLIVLLCPKTLYYSCQELDHRDFCMGFRCVVTL